MHTSMDMAAASVGNGAAAVRGRRSRCALESGGHPPGRPYMVHRGAPNIAVPAR
jgi:hypothetical protein